MPAAQIPAGAWEWIQRTLYVAVRTGGDPPTLINPLRAAIAPIVPGVPLFDVRTMEQRIGAALQTARFNTLLLGIFASVALILAMIGVFGVINYSVAQRTHEIGIRMALGAQRRDVFRLIVGEGLALTLVGVGLGSAGAFALTRLITGLLYGVSPTDPTTFIAVAISLSAVALLACYIPARRATKVDPLVALRYE